MTEIVPATQKSLILHKEGTPYAIEERPVPRPGPKDVLVKIMACALNPVDYMIVDPPYSRMFVKQWPFISGSDGAGFVVDLGTEVTNLKKGDRIIFQGTWDNDQAAFQQYAIVPADLTATVPENITFDQAASIPLGLSTVFLGIYNQSPAPENLSLRLEPIWAAEGGAPECARKPALIVGGASSLGQYAIQLARIAGHSPIITTASPHNAPLLKSLGATHVLDRSRSNDSILAELPSITGGKPIEFAVAAVMEPFDTVRLARDALAPGGALATVTPQPSTLPEDIVNPGQGKRVGYVFGSVRLPHTRETSIALFQHVTPWLEIGLLKPNPVEVLPNGLAGINDGLKRMKAKSISGKKLVARPQESP